MSRALEALGKTVIVEVSLNKEVKTPTGIIMPTNTDKESQSQGLVVSVGPEVTTIKEGDVVIISRVGGEVFHLDGRSFYALQITDVFCVLREVN